MRWTKIISLLALLSMQGVSLHAFGNSMDSGAGVQKALRDTLSNPPQQAYTTASPQADTIRSQEERNKEFYDNLKQAADRNKFSQWLHGILIRNPRRPVGEVVDEHQFYNRFEGKTIASIEVYNRPIFERARSKLQKAMENIHADTWKSAIRRDLLFEVGDELDADLMVRTKQLLKSRKYFYDAQIVVVPYEGDDSAVAVHVVTRDRWTIGVDGMVKGLTGRIAGDVYDHNFLGTGNRLNYRASFNWKQGTYEGSMLRYYIPNILGSFYEGEFTLGKAFWRDSYIASANKRLLLPDDYMLGGKLGWERNRMDNRVSNEVMRADTLVFAYSELDLWAGRSFYIEPIGSSIYGALRYHDMNIRERPLPVAADLNPFLHDKRMLLGSIGLYRQNYLTANLIYGYGFTEYIPIGFVAELNGGYSWEQFGQGWYGGLSARAGGFTPVGYFMGNLRAGGYFGFGGRDFYRSAVSLDMTYFTNLINLGPDFQLRQFVNVNVMRGVNRTEGVSEYVRFTRESGPRYFLDYSLGRNRLVVNTETVFFTPWNPLGFNIALFGFADVGWIGNSGNFFKNTAFASIGAGIRLRNEMLVFSTIELSITLGLGPGGIMKTEYVHLGGEKRITIPTFLPDKPQIVEYR